MVSDTLLPPNASAFERALESASSRISDVPVLGRESWSPDDCPVEILPWLADAFSVDTWDPNWTEAQKRATIKDSVTVHRHKGTIGAVRRALGALGLQVQVQEWFNQSPPGAPFTFRLLITAEQVGADRAALTRVRDVVMATKNLRSHLSQITPQATTTATIVSAGASLVGAETTVKFDESGFALILEGARNGVEATENAVDALDILVNVKLPAIFN